MLEVTERLDCTFGPVIRLDCGIAAAALISVVYRGNRNTGTKFSREIAEHALETDEHILWDPMSDVISCHVNHVDKVIIKFEVFFLSYVPHHGLTLSVVKRLFIKVIVDEGYDCVREE